MNNKIPPSQNTNIASTEAREKRFARLYFTRLIGWLLTIFVTAFVFIPSLGINLSQVPKISEAILIALVVQQPLPILILFFIGFASFGAVYNGYNYFQSLQVENQQKIEHYSKLIIFGICIILGMIFLGGIVALPLEGSKAVIGAVAMILAIFIAGLFIAMNAAANSVKRALAGYLTITTTIIGTIVGIIVSYKNNFPAPELFINMIYIVVCAAFIGAFFAYLRNESKVNDNFENVERNLAASTTAVANELKLEFEQKLSRTLSDFIYKKSNEFEQLFQNALDIRLNDDLLATMDNALRDRLSENTRQKALDDFLNEVYGNSRRRLLTIADTSSQTARYFLWISGILALSGVGATLYRLLTDSVFDKLYEKNWVDILLHAAPWIGFVLLLETLALIFFRYYSRALENQRHFTNEVVNIEMKYIGLRTALAKGSADDKTYLIKSFLNTERNFLLQKEPRITK